METTMQQAITTTYAPSLATINVQQEKNIFTRFINWCEGQEKYRFGWLGAALATHGCIATPLTLFAVIFSGNVFLFWILAMAAMGAALITNLAALPTKITIPVFFISLLIDIAIVIACIAIGFNISAAYI